MSRSVGPRGTFGGVIISDATSKRVMPVYRVETRRGALSRRFVSFQFFCAGDAKASPVRTRATSTRAQRIPQAG